MTTTYRMRERAIEDLKARIDQSRAMQVQAQVNLVNAAGVLSAGQTPPGVATALAELEKADAADELDRLQQLSAARLKSEADVLSAYANAGTTLWNVVSSVDLSSGLADDSVKKNIITAVTSALS